MTEALAYRVKDTPYNREFYPDLIGKGFDAPPEYVAILPYRRIATEAFFAPEGYTPKVQPEIEPATPVEAPKG